MSSVPEIDVESVDELLTVEATRADFEQVLLEFLPRQRWFARKSDTLSAVSIFDGIPVPSPSNHCELLLLKTTSATGHVDCYAVPVSVAAKLNDTSDSAICRIRTGFVTECSRSAGTWQKLFERLEQQPAATRHGDVLTLQRVHSSQESTPRFSAGTWRILNVEQSNSSVLIDSNFFLKLYRRVEPGTNPDAEIGTFLAGVKGFSASPRVVATIELQTDTEHRTLGVITEQIASETDAWQFTLHNLQSFLNSIKADSSNGPPESNWRDVIQREDDVPEGLRESLESARGIGRRTAELHVALASDSANPDFRSEPLTPKQLQELINTIQRELSATCEVFERIDRHPSDAGIATELRVHGERQLRRSASRLDAICDVRRIRCHSDLHLGQVLRTADDFEIIDFEGEPDRPLEERRQKQCALKDVAGMIRSFHYAANAASVGLLSNLNPDIQNVEHWQHFWYGSCVMAFLTEWKSGVAGNELAPGDEETFLSLLDLFLLEKVLYELRYEINHRPDWVPIPLSGLREVLSIDVA